MGKTYDDDQIHPDGISARDVPQDTLRNADLDLTTRGPAHGETHYAPGDGFLISNGGFSSESKARVYAKKVKEINKARGRTKGKKLPDSGTFLSEEEILTCAAAINAYRAATGTRSHAEEEYQKTKDETHEDSDAVDSSRDGFHSIGEEYEIDKSRSNVWIGACQGQGVALNGSKILHSRVVKIEVHGPDGRTLVEVLMSPEQFASALFSNSHTPATITRYWSLSDDQVMLTERVRKPASIQERMDARLAGRLEEQEQALYDIAEELKQQADQNKTLRKRALWAYAGRIRQAIEQARSNAAFTVEQAREEISSIMEAAAIQFCGQQIDARTLFEIAGRAMLTADQEE